MATTKQPRKSASATNAKSKGTKPRGSHQPASKRDAAALLSVPRKKANGAATFRDGSKGSAIVSLLKLKGGASIAELIKATGWQAHSVRGFLSGALKKKAGMTIASEKGDDGERRYRIAS